MKKFLLLVFLLLVVFMHAGCSENKKEQSPKQEKIVGFHIDMNIKQFRGEHLLHLQIYQDPLRSTENDPHSY